MAHSLSDIACPARSRRFARPALAVSLLAAMLVLAAPSRAVRADTLEVQDLLVSYYTSSDGRVGFVLDRSGPEPRLRFHGSRDIKTLKVVPATRGDVLLRAEDGSMMLRVTSYGPAIYYPRGNRHGIPLIRTHHTVRRVGTVRMAPGAKALRFQTSLMAEHISAAVGKPIDIEADWREAEGNARAADTFSRAAREVARAISAMADNEADRRALMSRLDSVMIEDGNEVGISRINDRLYVKCDADREGGVPDTAAIIEALRRP